MQKTRALMLAALFAVGLLVYLWNKAEQSHAYALRLISWSIAKDLLTATNSERVALIDHWSGTNFSAFLAVPANIETVKLGEEPGQLFKEPGEFFNFKDHNGARLCFTNQNNKHFEIHIRQVHSPTNYEVIGAGWD
ncbi:MAG: hypothetical protein QOJ40_2226 [Verrucomicrobiota bacterium]